MALLQHEHIARIIDGGVTESGAHWFAMEFVAGEPIDRHCDREQLSIEDRLRVFIDLAEAAGFAHQHGIVHRDIKPSNVLVSDKGQVKLLDFGIALPQQSATQLTASGVRVLTPEYASPEQIRGEEVGAPSDIYQLGLLLYQLLTGQRAQRFDSRSPAEMELVICEHTPMPPSAAATQGVGKHDLKKAAASRGSRLGH